MVKRRVYQDELHIHFVTFSCYKRRQHLQHDVAKRVVIGELGSQLSKYDGSCLGFVVMHNHVHSLVWFPRSGQLSTFMNQWKTLTSIRLKQVLPSRFPKYWASIDASDPIWQSRYYGLNLWSRSKVEEKLEYMHLNPVRKQFVEKVTDWNWSSARWYEDRRSAGIPIGWPPGLGLDSD